MPVTGVNEEATGPLEIESARAARLQYVSDDMPGIRRIRRGRGFSYILPDGSTLRDQDELKRVRDLAIPPAWQDVWICLSPRGHLQATGRDERGRKQYRYHQRWREVRDEAKFDRVITFGKALPRIRETTSEHLAQRGLPREKMLAAVVQLLEATLMRVGNEEYARENGSFGLTTLRDRHVEVNSSSITFTFRGKSGKNHRVSVRDPRLARIVQKSRDLPGQVLFQYVGDDGELHAVRSDDINEYLREITGEAFTAKDFRTWAGTVLAAMALHEVRRFDSEAEARKNVVAAVEEVASRLGNTPSICRKCYIHPEIINAYLDGRTIKTLRRRAGQELTDALETLRPAEAAVLVFLQKRLATEADQTPPRRRSSPRT